MKSRIPTLPNVSRVESPVEIFLIFLRLGCTSFGGPIAHLGYFNTEFVQRRKWLGADAFAQIVALCQFLPGPASSQVGMILGLMRGGVAGAALAWIGFTLPSALLLTAFALGIANVPGIVNAPWMHGLLLAAVAVVAVAIAGMYRNLCPDVPRQSLAVVAAAAMLVMPSTGISQLIVILAGALYGRFVLRPAAREAGAIGTYGSRATAGVCAAGYLLLLIGLPLLDRTIVYRPLRAFTAFYESGALVFGGGHVVLPLLQARAVTPGWISSDAFLAGYAAAQAVPGPLFTFAAYLGAAMHGPVSGTYGAALALFAIYLPSFLLIGAVLPVWNSVLRNPALAAALQGVNAAVVGLLIAAFYRPVWVSAIHRPVDAALALVAFLALYVWKAPPWLVVIASAVVAEVVSFIPA